MGNLGAKSGRQGAGDVHRRGDAAGAGVADRIYQTDARGGPWPRLAGGAGQRSAPPGGDGSRAARHQLFDEPGHGRGGRIHGILVVQADADHGPSDPEALHQALGEAGGLGQFHREADVDDAGLFGLGQRPAHGRAGDAQPVGDLALGQVVLVVEPGDADQLVARRAVRHAPSLMASVGVCPAAHRFPGKA